MAVPKPEAVFFDLDNTLTNRKASVAEFARRFAVAFAQDMELVHFSHVENVVHIADGGGYRPLDERWQMLQDNLPWLDTPPTAGRLRDFWYSELGRCAVPAENAHDVLRRLRSKGLPLGIITNGTAAGQNMTIDTLDIRDSMAIILISDVVGIQKPDARLFKMAADAVKLPPQAIWFVGDSPANDVIAAEKAGFVPVWKRGHHTWPDDVPAPVYAVDSLIELLDLIP